MAEEVKDGAVVESSTTNPPQTDTDKRDDSEKVETSVPWNEDKRWKEFIAKKNDLKEYENLGNPAEIKAKLQLLEYYNGLVNQAESKPSEPVDKDREALIKQARKELLEVAPELEQFAAIQHKQEIIFKAAERQASRATKSLMEEHGLEIDSKSVAEVSEILADIIKGDEDLFYDYLTDTKGAVKEAWTRFTKKFTEAAKRKSQADVETKKAPIAQLPKTHSPGGGGGESGGKLGAEPQNLKEATKLALLRLKG